MKNEEVQEIIEYAIKKAPLSKCPSGRLIHEKGVWFAIREAFNRGFERGEKRGKENLKKKFLECAKTYFDENNMYIVNLIFEEIKENKC